VPRAQAEVHAKAMTAMFLHNFDALLTRDYLDSRFNEFETRVEARLDRRLAEFALDIDKRFTGIDERFAAIDKQFTELKADINRRFAAVDVRFERIEGRFNLVYWMQGLTIVCVVVPLIRAFLG
jgi:hypothetical protein